MTAQKILIVDDELSISESITRVLTGLGFQVANAFDGINGLEKIESFSPDMIILDVDMPRLDGRSVLRQLRNSENWTPVIMLTKEGGTADRTFALGEGADDYINKPFDIHELVARIQAVLRRSNMSQKPLAASNVLICGLIEFNRLSRRLKFDGSDIDLKPKAASLLEYLLLHPDELLSRDRLLDAVWGWSYAASSRTVDNQVSELRKKLNDNVRKPRYIETVPGQGYRFVGHVDSK